MNKPILLTKKALVNPIEQALTKLEAIRTRKANNDDRIILEGLFALAVSTFEHSIIDTLRILLNNIPDKLDIKTESIPKKNIIEENTLAYTIENRLNKVAYGNIEEIIQYFLKTTDLDEELVSQDQINSLKEIKATRNLLIHNDLIINSFYKETAGPDMRNARVNNRLEIDQDYLYQSIVSLRNILREFQQQLDIKYRSYTKLKALEELFEFILPTPVMNFRHEFTVDEAQDRVLHFNEENSRLGNLSSSETTLYNVWLSHFTHRRLDIESGALFTLDNLSLEKLKCLVENLDLLKS